MFLARYVCLDLIPNSPDAPVSEPDAGFLCKTEVANFVSPAYDIANLYPQKINFRLGGLITSILSVLVCPWLFVASPQAITLFVGIFGAVMGPLFGTIISDYYLVKRQSVVVEDLYSLSPTGSYFYEGGWNRNAVIALGVAGFLSIGLALLGAYGFMVNVGDWGWLIGAVAAGLIYRVLSAHSVRPAEVRLAGSVVNN